MTKTFWMLGVGLLAASLGKAVAESPKARLLREDFRTVTGSTADRLDRSVRTDSPKAILAETRVVAGMTEDRLNRRSIPVPGRAANVFPFLTETRRMDRSRIAAGTGK